MLGYSIRPLTADSDIVQVSGFMSKTRFTRDWFSQHIPMWESLIGPLRGQQNLQFLEIGCYEGRATRWMLENVLTHSSAKIHVIDTYKGSAEHRECVERGEELSLEGLYDRFVSNINEYHHKVTIHQGRSQTILRSFSVIESFDFIYLDGSHVSYHVLEDAVLCFPLLRHGAVMIFDDYEWEWYSDRWLNPRFGVDAFLAAYQPVIDVVQKSDQVVVRKKEHSS